MLCDFSNSLTVLLAPAKDAHVLRRAPSSSRMGWLGSPVSPWQVSTYHRSFFFGGGVEDGGSCSSRMGWLIYSYWPAGEYLPQIFRGASSSSRMGWLRKISLDFRQRPLTSASVICTIFPGRHPLTAKETKINTVHYMPYLTVCKYCFILSAVCNEQSDTHWFMMIPVYSGILSNAWNMGKSQLVFINSCLKVHSYVYTNKPTCYA